VAAASVRFSLDFLKWFFLSNVSTLIYCVQNISDIDTVITTVTTQINLYFKRLSSSSSSAAIRAAAAAVIQYP